MKIEISQFQKHFPLVMENVIEFDMDASVGF